MKTIKDLNELIPTIVEELMDMDKNIGDYDRDEYESNTYSYEKDGWTIDVTFKLTGDWYSWPGDNWQPAERELRKAWGEVEDITAYYYDESTEECTDFSDSDLNEMWLAIDEALEDVSE